MSNEKERLRLTELDNTVSVLKDVEVPEKFYQRLKTGVKVIDEIFGGEETPGVLKGETVLFTGHPGAGKSTMALQLADLFQKHAQRSVLYNIGEESDKMLKLAANRIGIDANFCVGRFEEADRLFEYVSNNGVEIVFQDSLQSMRVGDLRGARLLETLGKKIQKFSKDEDVTFFAVGQVTKGGGFAGPQALAHDLDAHAHLRLNAETGNRVFEMKKNRLGPAGMPYEFFLSANGLDFQAAPSLVEELMGTSAAKSSDRKETITNLIKEKLLDGEKISGYCFERYNVDCSGGMWRVLLMKAAQALRNEGHTVLETKINGRTHTYLEI